MWSEGLSHPSGMMLTRTRKRFEIACKGHTGKEGGGPFAKDPRYTGTPS